MAVPVTTTVKDLPESRVRIEAEVPAEEIEKRVAQAARELGKSLRVPGFRAGKTPPGVVVKRMGREAVLDEAVRDSLPTWYAAAIDDARVATIGEPNLDFGDLPKSGEPLRFSIEIGVRPKAQLGEYKGLEVPRREPEVSDETVDSELDQLRRKTATLETVDRAAQKGDFVVMDFAGSIDGQLFEGGEGRDQMVELGSNQLVPGFEDQLEGVRAGEARVIRITFPDDYGAEQLAGRDAEFAVDVKEVKESRLPDIDDELATSAGFDTLDELKADIRERMGESERSAIEREYRQAAVDAAVEQATIDLPEPLVDAHAREIWNQTLHALSHQGIDKQMFLGISGRSEEDILEEGKEDARQALKREAVLVAVAQAEGIDPTDEELIEALGQAAQREQSTPEKLLAELKASGRIDQAKEELVQRQALDVIVDSAKPVPAPAAAPEATEDAAGEGAASDS
jgi:trigger factor